MPWETVKEMVTARLWGKVTEVSLEKELAMARRSKLELLWPRMWLAPGGLSRSRLRR